MCRERLWLDVVEAEIGRNECMVLKVSAVENMGTKVLKKSSLETRFLPIRDPFSAMEAPSFNFKSS